MPLPAEPALICAHLTERAAAGLSVGTIDMACGAISHRHRMHGLDDPVLTEGVRQVRRGLRRIIGAAPRRQARPLGTEDIRQIVEHVDRTTALGARDAAGILLGYASAMRRSELAALTLSDVEFKPGGLLLTVRRSKTDQYAEGQVVAVSTASMPPPTPSRALDAWLTFRGGGPGRLFTSLRNKSVTLEPISGEATSIVPRGFRMPVAAPVKMNLKNRLGRDAVVRADLDVVDLPGLGDTPVEALVPSCS